MNPLRRFVQQSRGDVEKWLRDKIAVTFPKVDKLIKEMSLRRDYKDVTFETLESEGFLTIVKTVFPGQDWSRAHEEFTAAAARASDGD